MKWPLVWRSTMERESAHNAQFWRSQSEIADKHRDAAIADASAVMRVCENRLRDMSAEKERAEVRAQEWEAIAKELIARGAGRPKPEQQTKDENPIAKRIREESNGDASLAAHFWNYARELRNAGKKDEEIVGMIGWDVVGPEQEPK